MIKMISAFAAAVIAFAIGSIALSSSAFADVKGCSTGYACLWEDTSFVTNGKNADSYNLFTHDGSFQNNVYDHTSDVVNNSSTSMANAGTGGSAGYVTFYADLNCSGDNFTKPPGGTDADFGNGTPTPNINNRLTSGSFDDSYDMSHCVAGN